MKTKINKTVLVITDGIGHNTSSKANAFMSACKPNYDRLFQQTPYSLIQTSGLSVGLPDGQMGNSEVGHMCIGSGRILYQNLVKISLAIKDGTLEKNPALVKLLHVKGDIHIIGLVSDGGVHSHIEHIVALANIAKKTGKKVWLHVITDGRDVSPTSGEGFAKELEAICDANVAIGSVGGRFYAMDRDNRWERVKRGYDAIVEALPKSSKSASAYIKSMYENGITDEFIEPVAMQYFNGIAQDDGVIFANFRSDRMRELSKAIGFLEFGEFERRLQGVECVSMTSYDATYPFEVLFGKEKLNNTLAQVLSDANLTQFHTAETEKYAHVTFFFNGGIEEPFANETRVLIPSPKVQTYDMQPQMSAPEVGDTVAKAMNEGYDFIVVNFANGDMVGHTGNLNAAIKAVESVDEQLGKILQKADEKEYSVVITSDHGNCEQMADSSGKLLTNHTTFEVYCFVYAKGVKEVKSGGLSNIAPTVLTLMGLPIPKEMNESLIKI
ncbi:MAG: 2,3-bisphosphoglycerate-independent phosphoglycerate mutase [Sulfurospirillaceae bacterium]|nr:2,3-bisphosphoglycerate-independent phosphoglycerate mutase [Sulfurospirillaceae bacterium]